MSPPAAMDQSAMAKKLLRNANQILTGVDDAEIFKTYPARELPSFQRSELKFGPILGVGGFCVVKEIRAVNLKGPAKASTSEEDEMLERASRALALDDSDALTDDDHYDISMARGHISKRCLRNGDARYAVKYMHSDLTELEKVRGRIDLAIEAKYLSVISHPNIIKMRGWADNDPLKGGFFLILDRLYGTLDDKMDEWRAAKKKYEGSIPGFRRFGANKDALKDLLSDRLLVAFDLATAFRYLHENKLVYRDIKSENIGFDVRGDVKVFDFGLMKNLSPKLKTSDGLYKLTKRTGSFPYMAPEVAKGEPYNCTADVFSYAILLWEILALKDSFRTNLSRKEYYTRISLGGERPPISSKWPLLTTQIMQEAWDPLPKKRPGMKRVANVIQNTLMDMTHDDTIMDREKRMRQRSLRSRRAMRDASLHRRRTPKKSEHDAPPLDAD